ncbi:MAG: ATP-binding cassette domain-containing protein [Planctomycetes bacterium]|jgi:zinc transport system ATP-binding protein|nr:ATP-binding cassette domain-containing protein [Planctomycetota bacterium]
MDHAVDISGLSFSYDGLSNVLHDVDLQVTSDETVAVVGPNGGGKTTLLKLLLGLLTPDRGSVRVLGRRPAQVRPQIGYVPQYVQFDPHFPVTAWDVVIMGRLGRTRGIGWYSRADRRATRDALDRVGLDSAGSRPFAALSGGQRQRVLIARALVTQPTLLLLDEPTANLDVGVEKEFEDLLAGIETQMAVMIVSHDIGFVASRISKVVCVNREVAVHPTQQLSPQILEAMYGQEVSLVHHHVHLDDEASAREGAADG